MIVAECGVLRRNGLKRSDALPEDQIQRHHVRWREAYHPTPYQWTERGGDMAAGTLPAY